MHYFLFLHCILCSFPTYFMYSYHLVLVCPKDACFFLRFPHYFDLRGQARHSTASGVMKALWQSSLRFCPCLLLDSLGLREDRKFNCFEKRPRYPVERTKCLLLMLIFLEREASRMKSAIRNADVNSFHQKTHTAILGLL